MVFWFILLCTGATRARTQPDTNGPGCGAGRPVAGQYAALLFGVSLLPSAALVLAYLGVSTIQLRFVSSIADRPATPLTLGMLLLVGRDRRLMGQLSRRLSIAGWLVFGAVAAAGGLPGPKRANWSTVTLASRHGAAAAGCPVAGKRLLKLATSYTRPS